MHILLTNIGQRNLRFFHDGSWQDFWQFGKRLQPPKAQASEAQGPPTSFRAYTRQIREAYAGDFSRLSDQVAPNILPLLIDLQAERLDRIILFGTDQIGENETNRGTDTCHAAALLVPLLEARYPGIRVEVRHITCSVVDHDELARQYRGHLREIRGMYPEATYLMGDAGGTSQLKSSLKLMVEFMIPQDRFEAYYVTDRGGVSEVIPVEAIEYRRVIAGEQALRLTQRLEYQAAHIVLDEAAPEQPGELAAVQLLDALAARRERLTQDALGHLKGLTLPPDLPERAYWADWLQAFQQQSYPGYAQWGPSVIGKRAFVEAAELLSLTAYYAAQHPVDYTQVVMNAQRFIEAWLKGHEAAVKAGTQYGKRLKAARSHFQKHAGRELKGRHGLPYLLSLALADPNPRHRQLIRSFAALNSLLAPSRSEGQAKPAYLDKLRNAVAHEGRGVRRAEFEALGDLPGQLQAW
ncbi:MAG: hypothetical protein D6722_26560, partial [Bacteroidetes bacterium]